MNSLHLHRVSGAFRCVSIIYHMVGLYCSMARVGHSGMTADEVTENIVAAVKTAVEKIRTVSFGQLSWTNLKILCEFVLFYVILTFN